MTGICRSRIVFWQGSPSPHQAGCIRSLAERYEVDLVCSGSLSNERTSLGWNGGDFGRARLFVNPEENEIEELVHAHPSNSVHLVSALHRNALARKAYSLLASTKAVIGLLAEGRDWRGAKGILRHLESFVYERRIAERLDCVLAMGQMGSLWHSMCGISEDKIFPFGYFPAICPEDCFTENAVSHSEQEKDTGYDFRLIFVGQLIPRKRVHLLLKALATLRPLPWRLTLIGDGPQLCILEGMTRSLGLSERVLFTGILKNTLVPHAIKKADLLVLPSVWDGWGAVVNEALGVGVPVVCSDFCGAQVLLAGERGETFPVDSVQGLAEVLRRRILLGRPSTEVRKRIRAWSQCISGDAAANYLDRILLYLDSSKQRSCMPRPVAPWLEK